jgi:Flp pilus assembly protein TadD
MMYEFAWLMKICLKRRVGRRQSVSAALRVMFPQERTSARWQRFSRLLRSFAHFQRVSEEEHAASTAAVERAVQLAPGHADCWAVLSLLYKEEYAHGFNVRPDPLGRAFAAAHHAIEADPSNHLGYHALASVLYFRHEIEAFRGAAERAMARNPMDGFTIAYLGFLVAYSGEWERGCALVERARSLNPHHPGWYWFAHLFDAYRKRDYRGAVEIGRKINMPRFWRTNVALAAAYGQLGERDAARNAVQALVTSRPEFALVAREELAKWWDPELVGHLIDGLRKAGLEIHDAESGYSASPALARSPSSAAKMAELPPAYRKVWRILVPAVVLVAVTIAGAFYFRSRQTTRRLAEKDTIVLADFGNSTGDAIFDDTLKTALHVSLRQSPFLNVLPDGEVTRSLQLMTRPASTKLTPEVAREVCQRADSKAYVAGSIARMGGEYVLGLKAVNCQSGDTLAEEQVTASSKEKVLDALGKAASQLRTELGESLATVKKFDVPLEEATTSSLEALKAYSLGHYEHAIELDPNFAMGYLAVGTKWTLSERGRAAEYITKAFRLREHASEREKLTITAVYYSSVTGELDKAAQTFQEVIKSYPRDGPPYDALGGVYAQQGRYEKAAEITRQSLALAPGNVFSYSYSNLANYVLALQRFDEARHIIHGAQARKLDDRIAHNALYALAFLGADSTAMAEQQQWFGSNPDHANVGLALASDTEAYAGHLRKARELAKQSVGSAIRAGDKESGAIWQENAALREAAYGNAAEARASAAEAIKLAPGSQGAEAEAALAFAMAGDTARPWHET